MRSLKAVHSLPGRNFLSLITQIVCKYLRGKPSFNTFNNRIADNHPRFLNFSIDIKYSK